MHKITLMFIEQLYTNCLAQAAYYIESEGEAAIIDPIRDVAAYLKLANERGAAIKYIFETHFHADFVSGHIDLAKETGATIIYGPTTKTNFPVHVATDGEILPLGKLNIKVLHTPGHTPESSCYLLYDENGKEHAVFTGDTLFVGDVGRPDLLDGLMKPEDLAGMMYDSLHNKLMPLNDDVIHYPGHGPGSACGKNIGKETFSTIGTQKLGNYALQPMSKEEFIKTITTGISPAPAYFFEDAKLNKNGYEPLADIISKALKPLSVEQFIELSRTGVNIIDTRIPDQFELGFVPKAYNFGLNGQYAIWAATLLNIHQSIIIVCEPGKEEESATRLARVGFDNIQGYLEGGFKAWEESGKRYDMVISIEPEEFAIDYNFDELNVLDVRKPGEWDNGHLGHATHFNLSDMDKNISTLNKEKTYYIHCAGGYRSMIAAAWLKSKGIDKVKNVLGGFDKIKTTGLDIVASN